MRSRQCSPKPRHQVDPRQPCGPRQVRPQSLDTLPCPVARAVLLLFAAPPSSRGSAFVVPPSGTPFAAGGFLLPPSLAKTEIEQFAKLIPGGRVAGSSFHLWDYRNPGLTDLSEELSTGPLALNGLRRLRYHSTPRGAMMEGTQRKPPIIKGSGPIQQFSRSLIS